jgi:hypothetical protein
VSRRSLGGNLDARIRVMALMARPSEDGLLS